MGLGFTGGKVHRSARLVDQNFSTALVQPDVNPIRAWVPSQKGLFALPPQRHRRACCTRATTRPVPLMISKLPRTCSGPSVCGSTLSGPLRTASMSAAPVGGSPLAAKFTSWCEPSQYGLFLEAPQRHNVARKVSVLPAIESSPRNAYGPASRTDSKLTGGAVSSGLPSRSEERR